MPASWRNSFWNRIFNSIVIFIILFLLGMSIVHHYLPHMCEFKVLVRQLYPEGMVDQKKERPVCKRGGGKNFFVKKNKINVTL